mgnify:FL=1
MKIILIILMILFQVQHANAKKLKMVKDENTKFYKKINDPTGLAPTKKVHFFKFGSECGDNKRGKKKKDHVGEWKDSDCAENSVRSEIAENVWDDNRPGDGQPKEAWYRWNVFLPKDFPIQDTGKLLLGQWHNGECPHVSFTSPGKANGVLYFETMKTWQGDCKDTMRIPFTSIQELRGKWTEFVMLAKWSNKADGRFQIYINGELAMKWNGRTLTKGKESRNYLKVGIYQCCNNKKILIKPASALFTNPEISKKPFKSLKNN